MWLTYYTGDTLALQSLRNMDKTLASLPISVLELDCPSLEKTTPDGEAILNMLILQKKKLKTVKNQFDEATFKLFIWLF